MGYTILGSIIGGTLGAGIDALVKAANPKPEVKSKLSPEITLRLKDWIKRQRLISRNLFCRQHIPRQLYC